MHVELRECSVLDGPEILAMIREIGPGENGFLNSGYDMEEDAFPEYLRYHVEMAEGKGLPDGWVPMTHYWLLADGRPVGFSKLRHYLTDGLRHLGGHIGYSIRPSARGQGFGSILLQETLKMAAEKKIPRVLITCHEWNTASRRVAERNGAVLEAVEDGECYYWIRLDEPAGIREIHPDDYSEIIELWRQTPGMGLSNADSEENIRGFLMRNPSLSFCVKEEGRICGTILCGHDGRRGYIYHLMVSPECRGRGIGSGLVERSLQRLKEAGIDKCHLFVFKDNEIGKAFWKASGWKLRQDIATYSKDI